MRYYFSAFLLTTIGFILVLSAIFYKEESYQRDATLNQSQLLLHKMNLLLKDEYAAVSQDLLMIGETIQDYSRKGLSQEFAPRLVSFMQNLPLYDQLRVIDASGMERMRINRVNAKTVIVPQNELQNKAHRYYFLETKRLKRNEIYISALDLNIENGKVEEPYKPTFRVATPLFDENYNQIGIVVINVLAESIFTKIKSYVKREGFEPLIANKNGEWLIAPKHERPFLFMFGIKRNQVQESCPKLWEELKYHESGFISQGGKNFTYLKFNPTESIQRMGFKSLTVPSASLAKSLGDPSLEELLFISYDDEIIFADRDLNISKGMPYFIFIYILTTILALYVVKLFISRLIYSKDLMLAEHFFKYSDDGVVITDPQTHILRVNERYCAITGFKESELIGQKTNIISSGLTPPEVYADLWRELSLNGYWEGELSDRRADGSLYIQHLRIIVIKNDRGEVTNYVGITSDITERKNSQEKIRKLAFEDPLTGLPNRTLLYDRLEQSINISKRMHTEVALLFIDLDDFKIINDLYGHNLGDKYLINVASRLKSSIRSNDTIARIGGDEFMIVLQNYDKEFIIQSATRILGLLQSKVTIEGHEFSISASIGIAIYPDDGYDINTLMQHVDTAMYQAKRLGKNNFCFYDNTMNIKLTERVRLEKNLRSALEQNEFYLEFQPQVSLNHKQVVGFEALIRWHNKELGFVPPDKFISVAEEIGIIVPITLFVLQRACEAVKAFDAVGAHHLTVAVNISASHVNSADFVRTIINTVRTCGVSTHRIELEITEGSLMNNSQVTVEKLTQLKKLGFKTAIDDFGTGYSSLSYLKKFSFDKLKIDKAFVHNLPHDKDDINIIKAVIAVGKALDMRLIAEGAETRENIDFLQENGCDLIQGYFFSKPLMLEKAIDYVKGFKL